MLSVVVDIDDTVVSTDRRRLAAWRMVLGREPSLEEVERLGSRQILKTYAFGDEECWKRFWSVLLCWENAGDELLELDEPLPFASQVLQKWSREHKIVYLTGRSANMHDLTLTELNKFGFPTTDVDLVMLKPRDWMNYFSSKTSHLELRARLFSSLCDRYRVIRVVDDNPLYFTVYKRFNVPDRFGMLRPKRYSPADYLSRGATRVTTWKQLWDDDEKVLFP